MSLSFSSALSLLLTMAVLLSPGLAEAKGPIPYKSGERLTYDVHVMGSYAGKGVLSVGEPRRYKGKKVVPLVGELVSEEFWKNVYPVNDRILSLIGKSMAPVRTEMQIREKTLNKDVIIQYNEKRSLATGTKRMGKRPAKAFKKRVPKKSQDMLSWLFRIRLLDFENKSTFALTGFSGNFVYDIRIKVDGKQLIWTKLGEKEGYVLKTTVTRRGGRKPFKKNATFWIGTDEERTPLKLAVDLPVGHVEAFLAEVSRKVTGGKTAAVTKTP
jgi:hypothetical protein